jgi:hypothetical protein
MLGGQTIFAQLNANRSKPVGVDQSKLIPLRSNFMEYVIVIVTAGIVALYTLLIRHWLNKA